MRVLRLRLYGLVFIVVLAVLLSLSVAVYRQVFTPAVRITLEADSLGNQLDPRADVKLRGLLVGEVRSVHADGTKATLDIALKPQYADDIPSDVRARLLPKTLFGEKYVDLVAPAHTAHASARPIRAGDVIPQDRTRVGIEVQQLMNDLLPLLRTVRPGKLNATLSAFATALEGRGDRIGDNLTRVEDYLHRLNPHLPSLTEDFARLADVAKVYGDAAPDLMEILRNTVTTSRTLVEQQDRLASALTTTATAADTADDFLGANGDRLISLGRVSRPTLELFARYSPSTPVSWPAWSTRSRPPTRRSGAAGCTSRSRSYGSRGRTNPARSRVTATVRVPTAVICRALRSRLPASSSTTAPERAVRPDRSVCPPPGPSSGPSARWCRRCWACRPTRCRRSRRCCSGRWHAGRR